MNLIIKVRFGREFSLYKKKKKRMRRMRKTLMQTDPYIMRIKEGKKCLDENRGQLTCIMNELLARRRDVYK